MTDKPTIRIFISSPADVRPERLKAELIVKRLNREFTYRFRVEAVLWEREPLVAAHHFQDPRNIPQPRGTDIVVVILWSSLGVRLPEDQFRGALSGRPVTGTEWEFEDALAGARERGVPDLLLYRKTAEPVSGLADRAALRQRIAQLDMVEDFIARWFRTADTGSFTAASHTFASTAEFEERLYDHIRALLERRAGDDGQGVPIRWHDSPFRGLLAFEFEHAPIFFGRTRARNELRELLARQDAAGRAFVLMLGASGSGKSSVVKAGLLPDLMLPGMVGRVALCRYALMRPSDQADDLLGGLAEAILSDTALPELASLRYTGERLATLLRQAPEQAVVPLEQGLSEAGRAAGLSEIAEARLVIIVDQLEEVFTLETLTDDDRRQFTEALDKLSRSGVAWIVATMRSDFYDRLETLAPLAELVDSQASYLLLPPDDAELGQMIRQPAREAGLIFEVDAREGISLDEVIRQTAATDRGALPLLSFLLEQLWQRRDAQAGMLTFAEYRALGGFEGSLGKRAEQIFQALPQDAQGALADVVCGLVTIGSGAVITPTTRAVRLASFPPDSRAGVLVRALLAPDARLLVADGDGTGARIRMAHEALISAWDRAREIVQVAWDDLQQRARIEGAAALWVTEGKPSDRLLPSGLALSEAVALAHRARATLDPGVLTFIESSLAEHTARLQERLRRQEELTRIAALEDLDRSRRRRFSLRSPGRALALVLVAIAILLRAVDPGFVTYLRLRGFDVEQLLWPRTGDPRIAIVTIDEASIAQYGQWPWPRARLAKVVRRIAEGQPRVLGIDLIFAEHDRMSPPEIARELPDLPAAAAAALEQMPPSERDLADAMRAVPTVLALRPLEGVSASPGTPLRASPITRMGHDPIPFLESYSSILQPVPELTVAAKGIGSVAAEKSVDGIVRAVPLAVSRRGTIVPSFALDILRVATNAGAVTINTGVDGIESVRVGDITAPTDPHGNALIHFADRVGPYISAVEVLDPGFDTGRLRDQLVLLGVTGFGVVDIQQTPIGAMQGIDVHAQLIESMILNELLHRPAGLYWIELAVALAAGLAAIWLLPYRRPVLATGLSLVITMIPIGCELALFRSACVLFDGIYPALTSVVAFGVMLTVNLDAAQRARTRAESNVTRIAEMFSDYMSTS
jgi:CHASE2 domain-containing sensor protein